jgi:hypothetical protein
MFFFSASGLLPSVTDEHRVGLREIPRPAGENAGLRDDAFEEGSGV